MSTRARIPWFLSGLFAVAAPLALTVSARAASYYEVTDLGTLNGSFCTGEFGRSSFAAALNDSRQVVGGSCAFAGFFQPVTHAYFWSGGVMTDLGTLGLEGSSDRSPDHSAASGINEAGQVVGRGYLFAFGQGTAFLWSNGAMTSLGGVLGGGFSDALDINNTGQIVGLRGTPPDVASFTAFRYDTLSGQVTTLPGLGGDFRTAAVAINDAGDVAGYATAAPNVFHAVRWNGETPTDLGTLGGTHSFALGINGAGNVVGRSWMAGGGEHAFLYDGAGMHDLGTLGGTYSSAAGINDSGLIVGSAGTASNQAHAFLHDGSSMSDLNDAISPASGWVLVSATAINSAGEIVGTGRIANETHAFLLTPSSPPIDTAPPVITLPADLTVEAAGPEGALVFYVATAADDVDRNPTLDCVPPSGSTFPVGTTAVACVATDNTGKSASASFNVTVLPRFDISLGLARSHSVDPRTGIVTIGGTVACNRGSYVFVSGQLTEAVAHRAVLYGSFFIAVFCESPTTTWSTTVSSSNGRFGPGPAEATVSAFACDLSCDSDQTSASVLLTGNR
jgi:probable HAF family extracellular repeat protein